MTKVVIHNYTVRDRRRKAHDADDPCWKGYEQRGTKEKNGKTVPNCVTQDAGKYGVSFISRKGRGVQVEWYETEREQRTAFDIMKRTHEDVRLVNR